MKQLEQQHIDFYKSKAAEIKSFHKEMSKFLGDFFANSEVNKTVQEICTINAKDTENSIKNFFKNNKKSNLADFEKNFQNEVLTNFFENMYYIQEEVYKNFLQVVDSGKGDSLKSRKIVNDLDGFALDVIDICDFKKFEKVKPKDSILLSERFIDAARKYVSNFENFYGTEFDYDLEVIYIENLKLVHLSNAFADKNLNFNNKDFFNDLLKDKILPTILSKTQEGEMYMISPEIPGKVIRNIMQAQSVISVEARKSLGAEATL
jgi:hypothetical protein